MSDLILDNHIFVGGDLTKTGLLLADLAPLPHPSNPGKSWAAVLDFFHALQGNVTNLIRKMERNGINTLSAHGEDLFGSEGAKASIRAELRLDGSEA